MSSDLNLDTILSRIGNAVSFTYPGNEGKKRGLLKDRAGLKASTKRGTVPYWTVVDFIKFEGEREPRFIRFGYYRGSASNWGSQTTLTTTVSNWRRMLVKAAREKKWFRSLLEDVMKELERDAT